MLALLLDHSAPQHAVQRTIPILNRLQIFRNSLPFCVASHTTLSTTTNRVMRRVADVLSARRRWRPSPARRARPDSKPPRCKAHPQAAGLQTVVDRYLLAKPITDPVDMSMM